MSSVTSANTLTAPNIFSPNALATSGVTVSNSAPVSGALYNTTMPLGRVWIVPSSGQIYVYAGNSTWLNISSTSGGGGALTWVAVSSSQSMVTNHGYQVFGSAAPVSLSLPVNSAFGDTVSVASVTFTGGGAPAFPGFTITQNAGQQILVSPTLYSTLGQTGSLSCAIQGASITLLCVVPNLTWNVITPSMSNFTLT